jgi:uncharacterized protein DUF1707
MTAPRSSRWAPGSSARLRASSVNPQLRVSDADRAEVADRLSKHYSDGRLDQAEFDERLDRAMRAKTWSDLDGLFADLPAAEEPVRAVPPPEVRPPGARPPDARPRHRMVGLILIIVVAIVVGHALEVPFMPFFWHPLGGSYLPWLLIGLGVFLWMRYGSGRRRRR